MLLMCEVLSDVSLHKRAAEGYKKVGQSLPLWGIEDNMVNREAEEFWKEKTTDGYANMREKLNDELAEVSDEHASGGLKWSQRSFKGSTAVAVLKGEMIVQMGRLQEGGATHSLMGG